jgi:hypothetical protein
LPIAANGISEVIARGNTIRTLTFYAYNGRRFINSNDGGTWTGWEELVLNSKFLKKNITFEPGTNVDVAYVTCIEVGDLFTIDFNINITANLSGGAKILTQLGIPAPWANGFALELHRNNSNENVSAFLDTFATEGKSLVLAQSTPSGTYRGVITCVKA